MVCKRWNRRGIIAKENTIFKLTVVFALQTRRAKKVFSQFIKSASGTTRAFLKRVTIPVIQTSKTSTTLFFTNKVCPVRATVRVYQTTIFAYTVFKITNFNWATKKRRVVITDPAYEVANSITLFVASTNYIVCANTVSANLQQTQIKKNDLDHLKISKKWNLSNKWKWKIQRRRC